MIKLLIADDEKIIRESISRIVNWEKLGIALIDTAADGLEALNIIIDESPEIIMTDIRMPGLSGLDLIRQISVLSPDTEFIILSGYSEFEYAREAMKCGVRHYLLKPCNEEQIVGTILSVKEIILEKRLSHRNNSSIFFLNQGTIVHIITDAINSQDENYSEIISSNTHSFNFNFIPYTLHYVFYLEHRFLTPALHRINLYLEKYSNNFPCYYIYVENTLMIFYPTLLAITDEVHSHLDSMIFPKATVSCMCKTTNFDSLTSLLTVLLPKIIHYETIYIELYGSMLPLSNRDPIIKKVDIFTEQLLNSKENKMEALQQLIHLINSIHSLSLIQQLASIIFSQILSVENIGTSFENETFFSNIHQCKNIDEAADLLNKQLKKTFAFQNYSVIAKDYKLSERIKDYIASHLQDSSLSLKWISENILFMSPDYVSKCFIRETGERFSQYLTRTRIDYAKKLLNSQAELNVQEVAAKVGCDNNPLYFSQLFKKHTGMTPSTYFKRKTLY